MITVSAATMNRKATQAQTLGTDESERILGIAKLIGQIEAMTLDAEDFDASAWLSQWIDEPLPAFGGKKPIDFRPFVIIALAASTLVIGVSEYGIKVDDSALAHPRNEGIER